MIPGWRQGWIIIHDRQNAFRDEVRNIMVGSVEGVTECVAVCTGNSRAGTAGH